MQHTKSTLRWVKVINLLVGKVKFHPLKRCKLAFDNHRSTGCCFSNRGNCVSSIN